MSGAGGTLIHVDVPYVDQDEGDECVVACCLMLLKWARARFGSSVPEMDYDEVKSILKKEKGGIALNAPKHLNSCKKLRESIPRIRFSYSIWSDFRAIEKELEKGYPVIA